MHSDNKEIQNLQVDHKKMENNILVQGRRIGGPFICLCPKLALGHLELQMAPI